MFFALSLRNKDGISFLPPPALHAHWKCLQRLRAYFARRQRGRQGGKKVTRALIKGRRAFFSLNYSLFQMRGRDYENVEKVIAVDRTLIFDSSAAVDSFTVVQKPAVDNNFPCHSENINPPTHNTLFAIRDSRSRILLTSRKATVNTDVTVSRHRMAE
jgi:hypothetical protein